MERLALDAQTRSPKSMILACITCVAVGAIVFLAQSLLPESTPKVESASPGAATPDIKYQDGQLTIEANQAPLADILRMVAKVTGASIDFPPKADERVAGSRGPGSVFEVLDELLRSTSFGYAILESAVDPNAPVRVIVAAKPAPRQIQGAAPQPANAGTAMTGSEEVPESAPSREVLEQRLRTIQEDLIRQGNARGQLPR